MGFELDTKDMERHAVELRLYMDKARRRFHKAKMADLYEKIVKNQLVEPDQDAGLPNAIQIETLADEEDRRRLDAFLETITERCIRREQQEMLQTTLRRSLQQSRRKSVLDSNGLPLEPVCFFCASDLHDDGQPCPPQPLEAYTPAPTEQQQAQFVDHFDQISRQIQLLAQGMTPPESAVPTPDLPLQTNGNGGPVPNGHHANVSPSSREELDMQPQNLSRPQRTAHANLGTSILDHTAYVAPPTLVERPTTNGHSTAATPPEPVIHQQHQQLNGYSSTRQQSQTTTSSQATPPTTTNGFNVPTTNASLSQPSSATTTSSTMTSRPATASVVAAATSAPLSLVLASSSNGRNEAEAASQQLPTTAASVQSEDRETAEQQRQQLAVPPSTDSDDSDDSDREEGPLVVDMNGDTGGGGGARDEDLAAFFEQTNNSQVRIDRSHRSSTPLASAERGPASEAHKKPKASALYNTDSDDSDEGPLVLEKKKKKLANRKGFPNSSYKKFRQSILIEAPEVKLRLPTASTSASSYPMRYEEESPRIYTSPPRLTAAELKRKSASQGANNNGRTTRAGGARIKQTTQRNNRNKRNNNY